MEEEEEEVKKDGRSMSEQASVCAWGGCRDRPAIMLSVERRALHVKPFHNDY